MILSEDNEFGVINVINYVEFYLFCSCWENFMALAQRAYVLMDGEIRRYVVFRL